MNPSQFVIITDMDGTLLDKDGAVPQNNLDAITRFTNAGGFFTLASGRYGNMLDKLFPNFRSYINAPAVLCNGAYLRDFGREEYVYECSVPMNNVAPIAFELLDRFPDIEEIVIVVKRNDEYMAIQPFQIDGDQFAYKMVVYAEAQLIAKIRAYSETKWGDKWTFSKSNMTLFEFVNPEATKGKTVKKLKELLAKQGNNVTVIAVGDYENDYDMLLNADIAACPSNAIDSIKNICSVHLCNHNDGCIAELIDKIFSSSLEVDI